MKFLQFSCENFKAVKQILFDFDKARGASGGKMSQRNQKGMRKDKTFQSCEEK